MAPRLLEVLVLAVVIAVLWAMPAVMFPHPGVNEALELSVLGPLVYIVTLVGSRW